MSVELISCPRCGGAVFGDSVKSGKSMVDASIKMVCKCGQGEDVENDIPDEVRDALNKRHLDPNYSVRPHVPHFDLDWQKEAPKECDIHIDPASGDDSTVIGWPAPISVTPDRIKVGKQLMVRCEVVEDYKSNCHVKVRLPNGDIRSFHLNNFLSPGLEPYTSWEF
jgi:hypothetical protein